MSLWGGEGNLGRVGRYGKMDRLSVGGGSRKMGVPLEGDTAFPHNWNAVLAGDVIGGIGGVILLFRLAVEN